MPKVVIFYEDALAPGTQPKDYGPHLLVLWCLVDRTARSFWDLGKLVEGNARKGKEQVEAACRRSQVYDRGGVIAVYDNDRVRELPALANLASQRSRDVAQALRQQAAQPDRTTVVLLDRNMETVVARVLECAGDAIPQRKPKPLERDLLLGKLVAMAHASAPSERAFWRRYHR